jgi:hypothetical protein
VTVYHQTSEVQQSLQRLCHGLVASGHIYQSLPEDFIVDKSIVVFINADRFNNDIESRNRCDELDVFEVGCDGGQLRNPSSEYD